MKISKLLIILIFGLSLVGCATQTTPNSAAGAVRLYQASAEARLKPYFSYANVAYPPRKVALLAFKKEKHLELWVFTRGRWHYIKTYPILAESGYLGPKLRRGDDQVPEGIYRIVRLNPHSRFHLSLMLNYPNYFDRMEARRDDRWRIGSNIFIHGNDHSAGCIAIGNFAIEELFVLIYKVGINSTVVIIAPNDLRRSPPLEGDDEPRWIPVLYRSIARALQPFPATQVTQKQIIGMIN